MNPELADAPLNCLAGGDFDRDFIRMIRPQWGCLFDRANAWYVEVICSLQQYLGFKLRMSGTRASEYNLSATDR